ncbi:MULTISPECIES: plasmid pRiA4b ORF-3 family protein [unclassified Tolypothrix]|uniref:plasmid pRiA4b ORF-3 family protein n=1 Tax=unclassified Tolypothrix TaxID=2649714 RepID=UPI0005EAB36A|nr:MULTISPECIES: plasmid pRiA4b ORF-3 family protein [unclassified Tolypothrix]EKE96652.1 plasmid protein [Tolypothrix sp. PCC 7601]MBE9087319.1 plasmid pRiA4b ORF-3 family protein [Tolypothrix sp. LEGE 11397]UYD30681.1 plasmid pRiA4b ORF-3 family protein [Tolypothrix sp. PCC 7712]UYD38490.1 plasmid pRiA4b ORF-3 family protein [Tolypothrix sp. PCC 7601]
MSDSDQLVIYQLHIFILGISPMIWRRVKIRSDSTIADLHYIIQIAMGWTDSHLHRFIISVCQYSQHRCWKHCGDRTVKTQANKNTLTIIGFPNIHII